MDKFSKKINSSEKAFYTPFESIDSKSNQRSLIPTTTQLIFPHHQVATLHLPTPNQIKKLPNYSGKHRL